MRPPPPEAPACKHPEQITGEDLLGNRMTLTLLPRLKSSRKERSALRFFRLLDNRTTALPQGSHTLVEAKRIVLLFPELLSADQT